ncbi:hypothetical protein GCM10023087_06880 [Microbacterium rhizosphaerae]
MSPQKQKQKQKQKSTPTPLPTPTPTQGTIRDAARRAPLSDERELVCQPGRPLTPIGPNTARR